MKHSISVLVLFAIVLTFTGCEKTPTNLVYDKTYLEEIKEVRKQVQLFMTSNGVPGANVTILKEGQIVYSEATGLISRELNVRATRDSKFRIGEVSELFTSFIYMRMVQEGKLHPDTTVHQYLPDYPWKGYPIPIKHLANQTSGLRSATLQERAWAGLNITMKEALNMFKDDDLADEPNGYQSNTMFHYNLLGVIMQEVSDMRYTQLLKTYLTDTLNLNNTMVDNPLINIPMRSDCFSHNMVAQVINSSPKDLRYKAPSSGLLSNSEDLAKFGHEVLHTQLLTDETRKNWLERTKTLEGMPQKANAWMHLYDKDENLAYGRLGIIDGGTAALLVYPDYDLVVAFTCNLKVENITPPVFQIASQFLPEKEGNAEEAPAKETK